MERSNLEETAAPVQIRLFDFDQQQTTSKEYKWLQKKLSKGLIASINILEVPKLIENDNDDEDQVSLPPSIACSEKYNSFILQFSESVIVMDRNNRENFKTLEAGCGISSLIVDDESDAIYVTVIIHMSHHVCQKLNLHRFMSLPNGESIWGATEWGSDVRLKIPSSMCVQYENEEQVLYVLDSNVGINVFNATNGTFIKTIFKNTLNGCSIISLSRNEIFIVRENEVEIYKRNEGEWKLVCKNSSSIVKRLWICNRIGYDNNSGLIYIGDCKLNGSGIIVLRKNDLKIVNTFKPNHAIYGLALDKQNEAIYIC